MGANQTSRAAAPADHFAAGDRLGRYIVRNLLRKDPVEAAYRAYDTRQKRDVMLTLSRSRLGSNHFARFLDKWRTGALFCHPNILAVYDFGWHEGRPFLVSELMDGETLRAILDAGPIPPATAAGIAMQIADGLHAAHRAGIVHGDLRPDNICVGPQGHARILNFSPARYLDERLEVVQQEGKTGTPIVPSAAIAYLSPEQASCTSIDLRSDIFSLGVVLYEMVTGMSPFRRKTPIDTLLAITRDDLPARRGDDPAVAELIDRVVRLAVRKDPAERFPSAIGMLYRLQLLLPSLRAAAEVRAPLTASTAVLSRVRGLFGPRELG